MSSDNENPFETYDYEDSEQHKMHERVMEKFDDLSDEEKFQTLVRIGIFNEDGELTERYGGDAPNPED